VERGGNRNRHPLLDTHKKYNPIEFGVNSNFIGYNLLGEVKMMM